MVKVKNKNRLMGVIIGLIGILMIQMPLSIIKADNWYEEEAGFYTLFDERGNELTIMASEMLKNDEYISNDNKHYTIIRVDKREKKAFAKYLGVIELPEFEEVAELSREVLAPNAGDRNILLYCTHSDESYVPSDGKPSIPSKGGIYDVAESFKKSLEKKGVKAILDKTPHDPHDAGAYRRSRQTAVDLIRKNAPVAAVFDIHRDAVPKGHYDAMVNGEYMSKVRIVIGKRNQNRKINEELAYRIKAIADKTHPGLIKDIYIGQGEYNQELSPRSLLFEFGTHEISKEAAQKATDNMADTVKKAIHGGTFKGKGKAQVPAPTAQGKKEVTEEKTYKVAPISQVKQKGTGRGILWFVIVAVVGVIGFSLISKSKNEMWGKKKKE